LKKLNKNKQMIFKKIKPTNPGLRHRKQVLRPELKTQHDSKDWNFKIEKRKFLENLIKNLKKGKVKTGGRNNQGLLTAWHRGGGHKRSYRSILFKRQSILNFFKNNLQSKVYAINYDPNRSASIALLGPLNSENQASNPRNPSENLKETKNQKIWYHILAPKGLQVGDLVSTYQQEAEPKILNKADASPIEKVGVGSLIHNIEITKNKGGQFARAAGTYAQVIETKESLQKVRIRLASGEERWLLFGSYVSIGAVSNEFHANQVLGKAGRSRWLNRRPIVRGFAMNPVDHPHGGRTKGGLHFVTPWGRPTHRFKLRRKKPSPFRILKS
jgi:large subunit ribosomal protein L2